MPAHKHSATVSTASLTGRFGGTTFPAGQSCANGVFSWGGIPENLWWSNDSMAGMCYYNINASHNHSVTINNSGSTNAHNNIQPYYVVYMWRRTA